MNIDRTLRLLLAISLTVGIYDARNAAAQSLSTTLLRYSLTNNNCYTTTIEDVPDKLIKVAKSRQVVYYKFTPTETAIRQLAQARTQLNEFARTQTVGSRGEKLYELLREKQLGTLGLVENLLPEINFLLINNGVSFINSVNIYVRGRETLKSATPDADEGGYFENEMNSVLNIDVSHAKDQVVMLSKPLELKTAGSVRFRLKPTSFYPFALGKVDSKEKYFLELVFNVSEPGHPPYQKTTGIFAIDL